MWVPFRLTPKSYEAKPGPHYAGYNERAIATTIDLILFAYVLYSPIHWLQVKIRAALLPQADFIMLDATMRQAANLSATEQLQLVGETFIASGVWKIFVATNFSAMLLVISAFVVCLQCFKTTPGKWLMGIKLTRTDNETFPTSLQLIVRYLASVLSCVPLMMGIIWMMFDKRSRSWHDMIAGTRVITTRPDGWYWAKTKEGYRWLKAKINNSAPTE
jgi:hypothetical protein